MKKRIYERPVVCGVCEGVAAINSSFTSLTLSLLLSPPTLPLSACVRYTVQCTCCVQHDLSLLLPPRSRSSLSLSACVVIVRGVTQPTDSRTSYTVHQFAANSHSLTIALSLALPLLRTSRSPTVCLSIINISCILLTYFN